MDSGRLQKLVVDKYQEKVLVGSWFERGCNYTRNPHHFETIYRGDYSPKPRSANDPSIVWDSLNRSKGYGARVLFDHNAPHFLENKSTTNDIAFNLIPNQHKGPVPRELRFRFSRYEPVQDYTKNYGNVTNFGLLDNYKQLWSMQNQDPRRTLSTNYQDDFQTPPPDASRFIKWAIPRSNSSAVDQNNNRLSQWKLRDKDILSVPNIKPTPVPHEQRCNPITWECPTPYQAVPPKCVL